MTLEMILLTAVILGAVFFFVFEIFPVDKVSVLVLAALVTLRLLSPAQAVAGFGNSATVTVACMLALSYGIQSTGALHTVANLIVDLGGGSRGRVLAAILGAVGLLSAFINNTAAVALFLPLTIAVAREQKLDASKLLMPMSFAAMLAGTCTLIGTSTNLLIYSMAVDHLGWRMGLFEITDLGLILTLAGFLYLVFAGPHIIPSRRTRESLAEDYRLRQFVTELVVLGDSRLVGKSPAETRFGEQYDVEIIEILRRGKKLLPATFETRLEAEDILLVQGDPHTLVRIRQSEGVALKALKASDSDLEDENIVMVEAFLSPTSRLLEKTLKEINFRRTFHANAMAIRSHKGTIRDPIARARLHYGDSLLILTGREQLEVLRQSPDFLVLEEMRVRVVREKQIYLASGIFLGIIALAAFNLMTVVEAALLGTGLMLATGCLQLKELYSRLPWQTIIMLACLIPLGTAMETTGLAQLLSRELVGFLAGWGPVAVLSGLYLLTSVLTSLMSNAATAVLMFPIGLAAAHQIGADPKPFVIAVMFAASASFMTPIGYQTNLFVFGPGGYRFSDFVRLGAPLNLIIWILASLLIPIFWPL